MEERDGTGTSFDETQAIWEPLSETTHPTIELERTPYERKWRTILKKAQQWLGVADQTLALGS